MEKEKIVSIEERIPKLKLQRRKKANRRLIIMLILFFTLILCIIYFQSPLSKVKSFSVHGNDSYTADEILKFSEISSQSNIWKINRNEAESKLEKLPEIKNAEVTVRLPNTVKIELKEYEKLAYLSKGKDFFPVLGNGEILGNDLSEDMPVNAPILIGFKEGKALDEMISSLERLPDEILSSISEIHYKPSKTDAYRINLFMNDGYEVNATLRNFTEKMTHYPSIISQLDPAQKGVIDLEVGSYFKAYQAEEAEEVELKKESED
ncbi:cell division protein FtsQ/DivIB [Mesobacillus foraminis]|uniref:cell division protein FtsQ/DivIB n=1 Tax=Mesobacillus foraminis TaxID=279826 RepID=UPI001BE86036|nr:cell division protein FtsQ/DivIB [Mesobacillus foraminis]MBT2756106.1 cell division protein FtsQ/DivIB [Mesobacillus foraminis]